MWSWHDLLNGQEVRTSFIGSLMIVPFHLESRPAAKFAWWTILLIFIFWTRRYVNGIVASVKTANWEAAASQRPVLCVNYGYPSTLMALLNGCGKLSKERNWCTHLTLLVIMGRIKLPLAKPMSSLSHFRYHNDKSQILPNFAEFIFEIWVFELATSSIWH
jgi:hypothetical protein